MRLLKIEELAACAWPDPTSCPAGRAPCAGGGHFVTCILVYRSGRYDLVRASLRSAKNPFLDHRESHAKL
jgi:hypothetical protein